MKVDTLVGICLGILICTTVYCLHRNHTLGKNLDSLSTNIGKYVDYNEERSTVILEELKKLKRGI